MNDQPRVREGFVQEKAPVKTPDPTKPTLDTPAPEILPSPAEATPDILEDIWPIVVKLGKPIKTQSGDEIKEISFREPTGGDINQYGNPVRMNSQGEWVIEERKMHFIMAALSGVMPPFLNKMDTRDWNVCAYELLRFFLPNRRV